jgi:Predicted membrane protein (DUF2306)
MTAATKPEWVKTSGLIALSIVPVLAGAFRLIELGNGAQITPYNARFFALPFPLVLHIVCASLFCLVGAFQFDATIRLRYPRWHRAAGRVVASAGIVAAMTGAWLAHWYPIPAELQGELLYFMRMVTASAMALAIVLAVRAVLQRRLAQHRAWMIRAYALGQGAGTQVIIMLPVALVFGEPTFFIRDVLMTSAWLLNVAVAEWIIRRQLPSFNFH